MNFRTKVAIKMSRSLSKAKESEAAASDSVESLGTDEEDGSESESREETPDLYRHSALGMYAGVSVFNYVAFFPPKACSGNG
jgi:E3 ubiquitin-protein ligase HUWE1